MNDIPKECLMLYDADYFCFAACQAIEYHTDEDKEPSFEKIIDIFEDKIKLIQRKLDTSLKPVMFFTGPDNFRKKVAVSREYKGNRKTEKPFHYFNLQNYVHTQYEVYMRAELEADDFMAIVQTEHEEVIRDTGFGQRTVIVTVDKDLIQVEGFHYRPEVVDHVGSFGPVYVTRNHCYIKAKTGKSGKVNGVRGIGYPFFYSQMLTGDTVDNIPGIPGCGTVKALKILEGCVSEWEYYSAVLAVYKEECMMPELYMREQAKLLHMVRKYSPTGEIEHWSPPSAP